MERISKMIGQRELLKKIDGQIGRDKFPKVSILIGEKGSGKTHLAWYISDKLKHGFNMNSDDTEVMNIYKIYRKVSLQLPVIYVFCKCDSMSKDSMSLIRKMIEDIPENAYIILTCETLDNIPVEIKNKAVTYMLEPYSYEDKCDYIESLDRDIPEEDVEYILEVASNIGDIKELLNIDLADFRKFVIESLGYILKDDNPLRIADKIALNNENDKIPLSLFLKAFNALCANQMDKNPLLYCKFMAVTGEVLQSISTVDHTKLFETWMEVIEKERVLQ